jgi:hypothetical protein
MHGLTFGLRLVKYRVPRAPVQVPLLAILGQLRGSVSIALCDRLMLHPCPCVLSACLPLFPPLGLQLLCIARLARN